MIIFFCMIYFLPWVASLQVPSINSTMFFFINLIIGWTVIGWIALLAVTITEGIKR